MQVRSALLNSSAHRLVLIVASVACFSFQNALGFTPSIHSTSQFCKRSTSMSVDSKEISDNRLICLDFDGVVVDSCDETTLSSLKACKKLGVLGNDEFSSDQPPQWLMERMRRIRPAIYVGWQIPVLFGALVDQKKIEEEKQGVKAMSDEEILGNYESVIETYLEKWGITYKDMMEAFGEVRDVWMKEDLPSWLDINPFYEGVPNAITSCAGETVIITTKQQRFATALVRHAGVSAMSIPDDDIYGLGMYKNKADVIVERMNAGEYDPCSIHFFEDRWPTLEKCLKDERLDGVNLYLCSWGYVTADERALAEADPRVKVLDLSEFSRLLTLSS